MIRPVLIAAVVSLGAAEPALPLVHPLFADRMVFPRERSAPVWGWAAPGKRVHVSLAGISAEAVTGADGRWQAALGPIPAGGPHELVIDGPQRLVLHEVLVGDVWLFAGQSNMELGLRRAVGGPEEAATAASATALRLCALGRRIAGREQQVPPGTPVAWKAPDEARAASFPAVAWFTGRRLQAELGVPVGLVATAWSGSNIRAWMPGAALGGLYADELARLEEMNVVAAAGGPDVAAQDRAAVEAWWREHDPGTAAGWSSAGPEVTWPEQPVPGAWNGDGVHWLVGSGSVPAEVAGRAARLIIGGIEDEDTTWVNGREVGGTRSADRRVYTIPAGVLVAGPNRIALRTWSESGRGRVKACDGGARLEWDGPAGSALLAGWRHAATAAAKPLRPRLRFSGSNGSATMLWNGGIRPLAPFAFAGAVWYQGEQDAGSPEYRRLLPALIGAWRGAFVQPELPFIIVGLPGFHDPVSTPVQERLTFGRVRDDQLAAATTLARVGLAVTTDLGDAQDVHPLRKREVGERVAAAALGVACGRPGGGGPLFVQAQRSGDAMRVEFTRIGGGGLELRPATPSGFAIAGADGVWQHASASLAGEAVLVRAAGVPEPVAVRYGWADLPPVTLFDRSGMPASPFRSDGSP